MRTQRTAPVGAPPRSPDGAATALLRVRCTPQELARYTDTAERAGVSLSAWVRGKLE